MRVAGIVINVTSFGDTNQERVHRWENHAFCSTETVTVIAGLKSLLKYEQRQL